MTHYVLIDNFTGFVWGEATADGPIEACRVVDQAIGGEPRVYERKRLGDTVTSGYHVYAAPADWKPVDDGQSGTEIDRVLALPKVAEVSFLYDDE